MKRFFRWLLYAAQDVPVDPLPVNFPAGLARFVFSNVDTAPQIIVWCDDHKVVSHGPVESNEVQLQLPGRVVAMGVVDAPPGALLAQVYVDGLAVMMGGGIVTASFDVSRSYTVYVSRWRVFLKWLRRKEDQDEVEDPYHEDL